MYTTSGHFVNFKTMNFENEKALHNVCELPALGMPFFTQSLTPFSSSYDLLAATTLASTTGIIRINYDN
jgi:hypothetical protein